MKKIYQNRLRAKEIQDFIASKVWSEFEMIDATIYVACLMAYTHLTREEFQQRCNEVYSNLELCTNLHKKNLDQLVTQGIHKWHEECRKDEEMKCRAHDFHVVNGAEGFLKEPLRESLRSKRGEEINV